MDSIDDGAYGGSSGVPFVSLSTCPVWFNQRATRKRRRLEIEDRKPAPRSMQSNQKVYQALVMMGGVGDGDKCGTRDV